MKPTQEQVLEWAKDIYLYDKWNDAQLDRLERFAALAYAAGAAAMKARAAKVCDRHAASSNAAKIIAEAIRALGDADE